jgi:hypothetical protein
MMLTGKPASFSLLGLDVDVILAWVFVSDVGDAADHDDAVLRLVFLGNAVEIM